MRINNKTHWQTRDLRAIITRVAAEELEGRPAWQRKNLVVDIVYSRRGNHTGCAYLRGTHATLRIPKGAINHVTFAWLCAHEFAHTRGMGHRQMPAWLMWMNDTARERYAWAVGMPIRVTPPTTKAKPTVDAKLAHVRGMLAKAETRVKRATTILRKWRRREQRLLRQTPPLAQAAGAAKGPA